MSNENMVWVPAGEFSMGSEDFYPEEQPVHRVQLDGFWMDRAPVTTCEFGAFVDETGYVTVAERDLDPSDYPGVDPAELEAASLVFTPTAGPVPLDNPGRWWRLVKEANWRLPDGTSKSLPDHPVVQVAYEDAEAYASWVGKSLPTEAEWEYAAHGGEPLEIYPWGNGLLEDGRTMANTWEGHFPWQNTSDYPLTSPVGSYPANGYGLVDMIGNTWEWTQDWWQAAHEPVPEGACCAPTNPRGGPEAGSYDPVQPQIRIPQKVLKGGSHLCAPEYCMRYRPAARIPQMTDSGTSHIGFRCVVRETA